MQACNDEAIFRLKLLVLSSFVHRNTLYETVLHFRFEAALRPPLIKPKPFASLNHFTVPVAMIVQD